MQQNGHKITYRLTSRQNSPPLAEFAGYPLITHSGRCDAGHGHLRILLNSA
jgi:hypothetical protein